MSTRNWETSMVMDNPVDDKSLAGIVEQAYKQTNTGPQVDWIPLINELQSTFTHEYLRSNTEHITNIVQELADQYVPQYDLDRMQDFSLRSKPRFFPQPTIATTPTLQSPPLYQMQDGRS